MTYDSATKLTFIRLQLTYIFKVEGQWYEIGAVYAGIYMYVYVCMYVYIYIYTRVNSNHQWHDVEWYWMIWNDMGWHIL